MSALAVAASVYRTQLQQSELVLTAELATLADTDGLTGCLNRRAFHDRLAAEIAGRYGTAARSACSSPTSTTSKPSTTTSVIRSVTRRWRWSVARCAVSCAAPTLPAGSAATSSA
jgi:hypothetical protein